jgi:hypothetical protein
MLSRAAKARMSAHETVLGHLASIAFFAASMTSNPRRLGLLGMASFSAVLFAVESIRTEPSQPCRHIVILFHNSGSPRKHLLTLNCMMMDFLKTVDDALDLMLDIFLYAGSSVVFCMHIFSWYLQTQSSLIDIPYQLDSVGIC